MTLLVKQWIKSTANANLIGVNLIFRFVLPSTRSSVITVNFFTVFPLSKDRYLLNNYLKQIIINNFVAALNFSLLILTFRFSYNIFRPVCT